jgi:hypothetical protein
MTPLGEFFKKKGETQLALNMASVVLVRVSGFFEE